MQYIEVSISVSDDQHLRENIMARLLELGFDSFMETDDGIMAYIEEHQFDQAILEKGLKKFGSRAMINTFAKMPDQNWNAVWESSYEPVVVDNRCMVRAEFHEIQPGIEFDILIHPKMSFGTAHHETTQLMIKLILGFDFSDKVVLDMGSGTGILAILAAMKGAKHCTAIDNDEWAYNNALENCRLNNISNIDVVIGDAAALQGKIFNVLLANINRNVLLQDMEHYNDCLQSGSMIFLSGFYSHDSPAIEQHAATFGWKKTGTLELNNWNALSLIKE